MKIKNGVGPLFTDLYQLTMAAKATVELRLREAIPLYQAYLRERPNDNQARVELISLAAWVSPPLQRATTRWSPSRILPQGHMQRAGMLMSAVT